MSGKLLEKAVQRDICFHRVVYATPQGGLKCTWFNHSIMDECHSGDSWLWSRWLLDQTSNVVSFRLKLVLSLPWVLVSYLSYIFFH